MKVTRKFDSLRSKLQRKHGPLQESTNVEVTKTHKVSPYKKKRRIGSNKSYCGPLRTRVRADSDTTIVPSTPRASRTPGNSSMTRTHKSDSDRLSLGIVAEPDYPEIPDEEGTELELFPPLTGLQSPSLSPPFAEDIVSDDSDSDDLSVASHTSVYFAPHLRSTRIEGYTGLSPSLYAPRTIASLLDIHFSTSYPSVWDLGSAGPDDSFVINIQLRLRSLDLDYRREPPQEIYLRVASTSHSHFCVPESLRAYEASYLRDASHRDRRKGDCKDLCKTKGWRFKNNCWLFDLGWKVTIRLFGDEGRVTTRKFVVQSEVKICHAIVRSAELPIHVTNLTSQRDMKGLIPFPSRIAQTVL